ncbi:MAG: T9SS type A sorting domain-containing protein, partial [Cytophagales bacterium]|nr:T9SS type A sorting domain-containing protein [Cytophagales bacterium]
ENALGCADTLSKQVLVLRSTDQLAAGIRLGPNPTADAVTVRRDIGLRIRTVSMRVHNAVGQEIFSSDNIPFESQIDFRSYGRGLYVVTFQGDGQQMIRKIVVN